MDGVSNGGSKQSPDPGRRGRNEVFGSKFPSLRPVHRDPTTTFTQAVVTSIARQYALPAIGAPHGPLGFHNETTMLEWLVAQDNQGRVAVGVTFNGKTTDAATRHNVGYRLRYNDTQTCTDFGTTCTDTLKNVVLPLQVALDGAFTSVALAGTGTTTPPSHYNISMKPFPHPDLPFKRDAMQQYGDMFLFAAFMFNFILQLSYLVTEKELRLREAMKQMGLQSSAYWTSWLITNTCLNVIQVLLLCGTGCLFQFDFFLKNAFLLYFCFFFITSMALTLASFFLSALLSQAEQARNLGFLLFIVFFIGAKGLVAGKPGLTRRGLSAKGGGCGVGVDTCGSVGGKTNTLRVVFFNALYNNALRNIALLFNSSLQLFSSTIFPNASRRKQSLSPRQRSSPRRQGIFNRTPTHRNRSVCRSSSPFRFSNRWGT